MGMNFAPEAAWPHLSSFGFSVAEAALTLSPSSCDDDRAYLAATILVTLAQRLQSMKPTCCDVASDVAAVTRLAALLHDAAEERRLSSNNQLPLFVSSRIQVALEHARRVQDLFEATSTSSS